MKQHNEFESSEEHEFNAQHKSSQNAVQEFSTVEELLRHDAAQTTVPAGIADRLQKSSAEFPRPNRSWWKKLLGQ